MSLHANQSNPSASNTTHTAHGVAQVGGQLFNAFSSVHLDLLLYVALVVLWVWRNVSYYMNLWRSPWLNYCNVLYLLLLALFITEVVTLEQAVVEDFHLASVGKIGKWQERFQWLHYLLMSTPVAMLLMMALCWSQTREHLYKIQMGKSEGMHDRAILILALPPCYSVLSMSAMVQSYALDVRSRGGANISEHALEVEMARYETCFDVADLYEAWALYQFGKLTLEVIQKAVDDREETQATKDIIQKSLSTMSSLMWTGTFLFLIVCLVQSGWGLYMWTIAGAAESFTSYEAGLSQFTYANLLASAAAIYNVQVVEHTFSGEMASYSAFLKFISVKLLVVFSFWQKAVLRYGADWGFFDLTSFEITIMHCTLIIYECFLAAGVHRFAWRADEDWYNLGSSKDDSPRYIPGERQPLLPESERFGSSSGQRV